MFYKDISLLATYFKYKLFQSFVNLVYKLRVLYQTGHRQNISFAPHISS